MKTTLVLLLLWSTAAASRADWALAENARTDAVIVIDPAATAPEQTAARELAATLRQITGATFLVRTNTKAPARAILIGSGQAARRVGHESCTGILPLI